MTNFVASFTLSSERDNYPGYVGVQFKVVNPVAITQIGIRKGTGATGNHTVYLLNGSTNAIIGSAAIDLTSVSVGAFAYAAISVPYFVTGNILMLVTLGDSGGGQYWADSSNFTSSVDFGSALSIYGGSPAGAGWTAGTAGQMFYGLDLIYGPPPAGVTKISTVYVEAIGTTGLVPITSLSDVYVEAITTIPATPVTRLSDAYVEAISTIPALPVTRLSDVYIEAISGVSPPVVPREARVWILT
jgi:hypothetical protein